MALDILHDNWGPYTHTEVENALKAYLSGLDDRINKAIQEGGVGLEDLSQEVRDLLEKANKALQPGDIAAWAKAQNKPGYTVSEITGVEGFQNLLAKLQDMDQKIQAAAQSGGDPDDEMSSTSEKPVQNKVIKAYVDGLIQGLRNVLNTITQDGATQGVIDTFNEVKAFLEGISSSDTLAAKLATLVPNTTTVNGKQLNDNIVIGMADIPGLGTAIGEAGKVKSVTINGTNHIPNSSGVVDLGTIQGAQGPKGDTGNVQVDGNGNVLIVNNLEEGGTGAALSAEMGKQLKGMIDEIKGEAEILAETNSLSSGYIKQNGRTTSSSSYGMTDFIGISDIAYIALNTNGDPYLVSTIAAYDTNKGFVRQIHVSTYNQVISINSLAELLSAIDTTGCEYLRFSVDTSKGGTILIKSEETGIKEIDTRVGNLETQIGENSDTLESVAESVFELSGEDKITMSITDAESLAAAAAANLVTQGYVNQSGSFATSPYWKRTGYIPVDENLTYVDYKSKVESNMVTNIALFDANKSFLSRVNEGNVTSADVFSDAAYVIFSFQIETEGKYKLVLGTKHTKNGVKQLNSMIAEIQDTVDAFSEYIPDTNTHEMELWQSSKYFDAQGQISSALHSLYKYVGEGKDIIFTTKSDDSSIHPLAILFDEDDNIVKFVLFPEPEQNVLKTYSCRIHVHVGQYLGVSSFNNGGGKPTYIYADDSSERSELYAIDIQHDEALACTRFKEIGEKTKAVMLDCGRKFFSVANIKSIIDAISTAGLNTLELHFSDNQGLRFGLDDMNIVTEYGEYDLSDALGDGITTSNGAHTPDGSDKWLTQTEMDEIISYAESKSVHITPAIDMPAHMGAILDSFPQFKLSQTNANILSNKGRAFCLGIISKYAEYFGQKGCKSFSICADEVNIPILKREWLRIVGEFMNDCAHIILMNGMIPVAFNDFFGLATNISKGFVVNFWAQLNSGNSVYVSAAKVREMGYKLVNANSSYYLVLRSNTTYNPSNNGNFDPRVFHSSPAVMDNHDGCMFCVWCDKGDADGADDGDALTPHIIDYIGYFGQAMEKGFSIGAMKFDATSGKPLWWTGSSWVDSTGNSPS